MDKDLFSIGEVSKIKEISIKTLRYYHKVGILVPRFIDEETGYRYYSIDQFIYIDIIKSLRGLGTSIVELQEIINKRDMDKLLDFLEEKRNEAEENIKNMRKIINNIDIMSKGIQFARKIINNHEIEVKLFDERSIVIVPCNEVGDLKELIYYSNLDKVIKENDIKTNTERGIRYNINSNKKVESMYAFQGIEDKGKIDNKENLSILPKGKYLTLIYSKENVVQCEEKMINYIKENNLRIKEWIEIELFNNIFETELYNCQIQVLVEEV